MADRYIKVEEKGPVAVVQLARPEKKNALSIAMLKTLKTLADDFALRTDIKAVVFTGGQDYFTAGMDLADPAFSGAFAAPLCEKQNLMRIAPNTCKALEAMPQFTIAAIEGFCLGGGVSLAVSLDTRVMGQSASIRAPEIAYGMNMSWGTVPRLLHLMGPARTKEFLIFAQDALDAKTAKEWGFAQHLCQDGKALETAIFLAQKAAAMPFHAISMTKQTVNALSTALDNLASHMDHDQFLLSISDPESLERILGFVAGKKTGSGKGK
ncbi:MAG: enoyl-CoA hydratase/isomerase family protein [Desulfatibacillaceae bacterium]|nr:enoyl-CoA hydratase/isomerase family protein [Desulfatibacillaceae bacterium]